MPVSRRRRVVVAAALLFGPIAGVLLVPRYRAIAFDFVETAASAAAPDDEPAPATGFKAAQLRYPRVRDAYEEKRRTLAAAFQARRLAFPPRRIFLRAFKHEQVLELWAANAGGGALTLVKTYEVCGTSGGPGPKRRQGDGQVPEGFYRIDHFNPQSSYHLSLRVDYPNLADRRREGRGPLGGDIYIHGSCVTIGCIPITNDGIKELYVAAVEAKAAGQAAIPIHVFPARMDRAGMADLDRRAGGDAALREFWRSLKPGYDAFESTREVPAVTVDAGGAYRVSAPATPPAPP